jgi:tetratricopeptide (TPR) repeat protein
MKNKMLLIFLPVALSMMSCTKFLDKRSDTRLAVPETLEDNQALMDRNNVFNNAAMSGEVSAGDIYVTDQDFNLASEEADKRLYTWQPDRVARMDGNDWSYCFFKMNIFNTVLYDLEKYGISGSENLRGQALVYRAANYLEAAQLWCLAYNKTTAASEPGMPLRLDPDMNRPSVRATLQQTYEQIIKDLQEAVGLLPVSQVSVIRPSKLAALGFLARTYLYMGDYEKALLYGKQLLDLYSTLIDFNVLNKLESYPLKTRNAEVLWYSSYPSSPLLGVNVAKIPLDLYNSYDENDLRKSIYFKTNTVGEILFRGNYSGSSTRVTTLSTDEMYLTVAECYARLNDVSSAMKMLNKLMIKRWAANTFTDFTAANKEDALKIILAERRKELLLRSLRWADIKRYNRDGANITLVRTISGNTYTLPPNDLRYAIAIPEDIIKLTGMSQNRR